MGIILFARPYIHTDVTHFVTPLYIRPFTTEHLRLFQKDSGTTNTAKIPCLLRKMFLATE